MDTTQDQPVGLGVKGLGHCSFVGDEEKPVTSGNFGCFRKHRGLNSRNGEWSQKTGIFFDSINFNLMMFGSSDPTKRQDKTMVLERQSKDLGRLVRWRQKIVSVFSQKGRHPTRSLIISLRAFLANQSKVCPCFMQDDAKMQNLMVVADGGHIRKNLGCIFIRYGSVRLTWCVTGFPINSWNPQLTFLGYFWLPNFGHFWILTLDGWVMLQITKLICRSSHLDPQILRNLTVIMFGCEFQLILMSLSFFVGDTHPVFKKKEVPLWNPPVVLWSESLLVEMRTPIFLSNPNSPSRPSTRNAPFNDSSCGRSFLKKWAFARRKRRRPRCDEKRWKSWGKTSSTWCL